MLILLTRHADAQTYLGDFTSYEALGKTIRVNAGTATVRFTFYRPEIVRVDFLPFPSSVLDSSLVVIRDTTETVAVAFTETDSTLQISSGAVSITCRKRDPLRMSYRNTSLLLNEPWSGGLATNGTERWTTFSIAPDEHFYVTGERGTSLDKRGQAFDSYNTQAYGYGQPLYDEYQCTLHPLHERVCPLEPEEEQEAEAEERVAAGAPAPATAAPPAREAPAERAEVARVDADLLDNQLNAAGEVSIYRSRLEQQVSSIDFNLAELGRVVQRLKDQLRKLEIETEAQILHRHVDAGTRRDDFDPLELDRYSSIQQYSRALAETSSDVASVQGLLATQTPEAQNLLLQQGRIVSELQGGLMRTRMVPFQRHVQRLGTARPSRSNTDARRRHVS